MLEKQQEQEEIQGNNLRDEKARADRYELAQGIMDYMNRLDIPAFFEERFELLGSIEYLEHQAKQEKDDTVRKAMVRVIQRKGNELYRAANDFEEEILADEFKYKQQRNKEFYEETGEFEKIVDKADLIFEDEDVFKAIPKTPFKTIKKHVKKHAKKHKKRVSNGNDEDVDTDYKPTHSKHGKGFSTIKLNEKLEFKNWDESVDYFNNLHEQYKIGNSSEILEDQMYRLILRLYKEGLASHLQTSKILKYYNEKL